MTDAPRRAAATAAAVPEGPPPTTSTSHAAWTGTSRAASRTLPRSLRSRGPRSNGLMSETRRRSSVGLPEITASAVEENRLVLALKDHVPFQHARLAGLARDQRAAPLLRHQGEHRVLGVCGFVREVDARHELLQLAAHEDHGQDVRRLRLGG